LAVINAEDQLHSQQERLKQQYRAEQQKLAADHRQVSLDYTPACRLRHCYDMIGQRMSNHN